MVATRRNSTGRASFIGAKGYAALVMAALCAAYVGVCQTKSQPRSSPTVGPGTQVSVEYTMSDERGVVIESNKGAPPLVFVVGKEQGMIPALEAALTGLRAGEQKKVKLASDEAYGPVLKEAFKDVPKNQVPPEARKVGAVLRAQSTDGRSVPVRVSEVRDETVVIDFNHPLAGQTLVFDVKVLAVTMLEPSSEVAPGGSQAEGLPR